MEYPVYTAKLLLSKAYNILKAVGNEYEIDLAYDATENVEDALEILDGINTQGVDSFIEEIQAIDEEDIDWDNLYLILFTLVRLLDCFVSYAFLPSPVHLFLGESTSITATTSFNLSFKIFLCVLRVSAV